MDRRAACRDVRPDRGRRPEARRRHLLGADERGVAGERAVLPVAAKDGAGEVTRSVHRAAHGGAGEAVDRPRLWAILARGGGISHTASPRSRVPKDDSSDRAQPAGAPGQTILGRFRIERTLGHGGMGEVLLAHDLLLRRRIALKRLRSEGAEGEALRSAVLREARRASQVNDPRIAAIYDVLDLENDVFIVMEYVEGTTLRERMAGPLPAAEFWDIATQCVDAVAGAHDHGILHRDIKPENLIVTPDGRIKILDFGIARRAEMEHGTPTAVTTIMTIEGRAPLIAGTPQYMAPEAHYGARLDARADIFSLGTLFYELLTGRNPFAGPSYDAVLERVMNAVPVPASDVNPSVGPGLSAVIARMMAKDPAERY